jgi:hypothetical protein
MGPASPARRFGVARPANAYESARKLEWLFGAAADRSAGMHRAAHGKRKAIMENNKSNSTGNRAPEAPPASTTGKVGQLIAKGEHRVQERAQKVRHALTALTTKTVHSAQETVQKVVNRTKEAASAIQHRSTERASATGADKTKDQR